MSVYVASICVLIAAPEACFYADSRADVMNFTSDDGLREQKSCISMKWLHSAAWLVGMEWGPSPRLAPWLELIEADQQSASWHVFLKSPLELFFPGCHISIAPAVFSTVGLSEIGSGTSLRSETWPSALGPSSFGLRGMSPAHVQPIALFCFNLVPNRNQVNMGLLMASGFRSQRSLLALFSPLLRFSSCCPADFVGFLTG